MKILFLSLFLISNCIAGSRVDNLVIDDSNIRLIAIEEIQSQLVDSKKEILSIENQLNAASKKEGHRKIFVTIRNVAALTAAISLVITGTISIKARSIVDEGAIYNHIATFLGAIFTGGTVLVAAGAEVGVYLSKNEAKELKIKFMELKKSLVNKENALTSEIKILCKEDPRNRLCY
jgi:hypothetical protein